MAASTGRSGRIAVVTGGASGIGQAFARRLAQDGHAVAIADVVPAEETEAMVRNAGRSVLFGVCDVSEPSSVMQFARDVSEQLGRVEILVHCAGIFPLGPYQDVEWPTWRRIMQVNVDSLFHLTKAFLPGMEETGWGRIVLVASAAFFRGSAGSVAYTTSKGAVIGFVRSLAAEIGPRGITINAIAPGLVRTPGTLSGPQQGLGMFESVAAARAIKRDQVPEDLEGVLSFLASDGAGMMTGQTLVVDGGLVRN